MSSKTFKVNVVDLNGKKTGDLELDASLFKIDVRKDIITQVVNWQLAKRRAGTHATRTISQISGTTRKPWRQKGTGNARAGSLRSVQFRGGAVSHGPTPRSHAYKLNKRIRRLAMRSALADKLANNKLMVVDNLDLKSAKTKELSATLEKNKWSSALFVDNEQVNENFLRAVSNIPHMDVMPQIGANVYDILRRDTLVMTKDAIIKLQERLQ